MKKGKLIRGAKGMIEAKCPYCEEKKPLGVWAVAHLSEVLRGTCQSCGKHYLIGGR